MELAANWLGAAPVSFVLPSRKLELEIQEIFINLGNSGSALEFKFCFMEMN